MNIATELLRLARDTRGATVVEYGLILAMVFMAMVGAVVALGTEDTNMFDHVSSTAVGAMKGNGGGQT